MSREIILAIIGLVVGVLFASALFLDQIERNNWTSDNFITGCNSLYGNESWFLVKVNGKYSCMGNSTIIIPEVPEGWNK